MYLRSGDLIAIASPSRAISADELEPAVRWLESQGFRAAVGPHAHSVHHQFAGTDQQRAQDIQEFIDHKEVKAVWSSRGGYGGVRIIDQLDLTRLKQRHKWLVGYSDFTVFHSHLHKLGVPTIHGTMPVNVKGTDDPAESRSLNSLLAALTGEELSYALPSHELSIPGDAEGILVGGNLSILYSLMASPSDLDTSGKILFIEDLDEYLYHIDRMLMNLKRSGKLAGLKALVVGGMTEMNDNTIPYGKNAVQIVREHVDGLGFPVYFGFEAGHTKTNLALRMGMKARIADNRLFLPS